MTVAMLARNAGGLVDVSEMGVFWRSWWLGGLAGGLVVVPLALAWAHAPASVRRGRRAVEGALTLAAVIGLSVIAFSAAQPLTYIVFPALTTCCLAAIVSERRRAALELAESQRHEAERAALERQRIARDLHDSASQSLFSTTLHVRTAQRALEVEQLDATGPVGEELSEIGQLTRGALAEMRALILELRPGALAEEGLVAALTKQAAALGAREGLAIEVSDDGAASTRLPWVPNTSACDRGEAGSPTSEAASRSRAHPAAAPSCASRSRPGSDGSRSKAARTVG